MATTQTSIVPPIPVEEIPRLEELLGRSLAGWEDKAPRWYSPVPQVAGAWFDVEEVARIIRVLRQMPHTKGRQWQRKPFEPEAWQIVWLIAPVFGWKNADGLRIVREVWFEVPRKAGKSTISSRLALVLATADGELGPEVYAAATSTDQARQVFNEAKFVAIRSPAISKRCEVLTSVIRVPETFGVFRVLSKVAESVHGLNVSGAVVDEIHLHKKRDLIDAIETGTGAREQPLIFYITTAGDDDETTIYAEKHHYAVSVAEGSVSDPSVWVCIWAADKDDDPFAPETWAKANPNYPLTPRHEYLAQKAEKARVTPSFLPTFLRLHLNIRTSLTAERWPGSEAWNEEGNVALVVEEKLAGERCWGGVVAASATDIASTCWVFPNPEGEGVWALWRFFIPEDRLGDLNRRSGGKAEVWRRNGILTVTDGDQLDINAIVDRITTDANTFDVREIAHFSGNALGIAQPLVAEGLPVVPISSNTPGSSLVDWERMLRAGEFNHGGNPIAAWQVAHVMARDTTGGTQRLDMKASKENVYGILACELALRRYIVGVGYSSPYEEHGLLTV